MERACLVEGERWKHAARVADSQRRLGKCDNDVDEDNARRAVIFHVRECFSIILLFSVVGALPYLWSPKQLQANMFGPTQSKSSSAPNGP
jgi:hypothetical protein